MNTPTIPDLQKFYAEVWNIVARIPRGKVASYGQIAKMITPPAGISPETYLEYGALWVSNAVSSSPNEVPWQRVVSSKGEINDRDKIQAKRHQLLLEDEGVPFGVRGRIDMKKYGWNGK